MDLLYDPSMGKGGINLVYNILRDLKSDDFLLVYLFTSLI